MNPQPEKDVRSRLQETLQRYGIKQVDVARETGVHHSTLSLWLQGKIKGHQVKIEEIMDQWLQNLHTNKPRFSKGLSSRFLHNKPSDSNFYAQDNVRQTKKLSEKEELIPVRLDVEIEGKRFKENICWNVNEPFMTPEAFAKTVAEEHGLSPAFEHDIATSIRKAIAGHKVYVPQAKELIKTIEIDIRIENVNLKDRFEWDISDPDNSPEEFAYVLCKELGLNNEFMTQISHSIREQIQKYQRQAMDRREGKFKGFDDLSSLKKSTRSLLESSSGYTNLNIKQDQSSILINEHNYLRDLHQIYTDLSDNLSFWEPRVELLDPSDISKVQKTEDRKIRYEKRKLR